ncbi:MAG: helix-turn-helix domain-containing protein, partial [Planctomycetaceae bacterium]|nr:helix-turn-helix domain-containing protein [Planctomycetaceae bacterium]
PFADPVALPRYESSGDSITIPLTGDLKIIERQIISEVIKRCQGNKAAAARALGLHRKTLYRLLEASHPTPPAPQGASLTVNES